MLARHSRTHSLSAVAAAYLRGEKHAARDAARAGAHNYSTPPDLRAAAGPGGAQAHPRPFAGAPRARALQHTRTVSSLMPSPQSAMDGANVATRNDRM